MLTLKVQRLDPNLPDIKYATPGSAGFDLCTRIDCELHPGTITIVPTGIALEFPNGWEVQVRARSGLAAKHGIGVLNAPGTIDSDFRGEIQVILIHCGTVPFYIEYGMRIAQAVVCPVIQAKFEWVDTLSSTERGESGFGSTGLR